MRCLLHLGPGDVDRVVRFGCNFNYLYIKEASSNACTTSVMPAIKYV